MSSESFSLRSTAEPLCKHSFTCRTSLPFCTVSLPLQSPGISSIHHFPLVIKFLWLSLSGRYSRYKMAIHPAPRQRWEYITFCVEHTGAVRFNIWPTWNIGPMEKSQISSLWAQSPSGWRNSCTVCCEHSQSCLCSEPLRNNVTVVSTAQSPAALQRVRWFLGHIPFCGSWLWLWAELVCVCLAGIQDTHGLTRNRSESKTKVLPHYSEIIKGYPKQEIYEM